MRWLDSEFGFPGDAPELLRSAARWASSAASSVIAGSMWVLSQVTITLFTLFYFLRDGQAILTKLQRAVPLPPSSTSLLLSRITQTIRVSLGGKLVVAALQGLLGGVMFVWLHLPAPLFWGCVMGVLSVFPVIGAFVVWIPLALIFASQGDWRHVLFVVGWGVLIIHPVDNLLGPVLVGTTLRVHTLLMFFSIVGGLAAFGAAGIVIGPLVVAVLTGLYDLAESWPGEA